MEVVTNKLYDALYSKHKECGKDESETKLFLPVRFKPTLRIYQQLTVLWLLRREQIPDNLPLIHYIKQRLSSHAEQDAPMETPNEIQPGGILADEMGLGKTVEVLALILLHRRKNIAYRLPFLKEDEQPLPAKRCKQSKSKISSNIIFCICNSNKHKKNMLQCTRCELWQHIRCVGAYNSAHTDEVNDPYLCPSCWSKLTELELVKTRATFIVTPRTLTSQWLSEIQRHTQNPTLQVLLYNSTWISPRQLGDYDIVLTDYNTLRGEFHHMLDNKSDRKTRNAPRSMSRYTPLMMMNWWRVCLDEAQNVESNISQLSSMVRRIPAVNRWAVTGTPIQRSIEDLKPLLNFIGCYQLDDIWHNIAQDFVVNCHTHNNEFSTNHQSILIEILQKCMWRTCKSKVKHELDLPPQTELVHRIDLSDLEKLYYTEQHADCETKFNDTVNRLVGQMDVAISPTLLKLILQPLLKIRQCCSIPVVIGGTQTAPKQFLQPKELYTHLKAANEIDCKSQLRSMASSYNGMAAIEFIRKNYDEAIRLYKLVLQLALDYKYNNICVDSLLQIHAIHNMLEAYGLSAAQAKNLPAETKQMYTEQLYALEWKYLEPYSVTLARHKSIFGDAQNALHRKPCAQLEVKGSDDNEDDNALHSTTESEIEFLAYFAELTQIVEMNREGLHIPLLDKIYEELQPQYADNERLKEIQSISGALYVISVWYDKVTTAQNKLLKEFQELQFFTDNLRVRNEVSEEDREKIMLFNASVYDCHLSEIREKDDKAPASKKKVRKTKKNICKLCEIKNVLNSYECLLFTKVIDETTNLTEGLDNPSFEINLIKVIFAFIKLKKPILGQQIISSHWEALENIQSLCKKLIKYWIEIEFTVKAYDELDMCKMRISLTDDENEKSNFKISEYELDNTFQEQQISFYNAQHKFVSKLARLKYIIHLEDDSEPGPCPICQSEEEARYVVLECGHHICILCLKSLNQYKYSPKLTCSVCRHQQNSQKIYYVTRAACTPQEKEIKIIGNYSSKIIYIVRLILQLKREHTTTKILIFSQWQPILNAIAKALAENGVHHRNKLSSKSLEEFKDPELGITCLLIPYSKGSSGLNLIEATHVCLVEPILNPGEELQAIGRVHRFGQEKPTTVHRFIVNNTIEEKIFNVVTAGTQSQANWEFKMSPESLQNLFKLTDVTT